MKREMPFQMYEECACQICVKEPGNLLIEDDPHLSFGRKFIQQILDKKKLTESECAAEYWRLKADLCTFARITDSPVEIDRKATIMHRFATTPAAKENRFR